MRKNVVPPFLITIFQRIIAKLLILKVFHPPQRDTRKLFDQKVI